MTDTPNKAQTQTDSPKHPEAPHSDTPKKSKKKRWCCILGGIISIVFILFFGLIAMLSTSAGQVKLIEWADKWINGLSIESVSGGFADGLELSNIHYQSDGVDALIAHARLQLDLNCLWQRKICLQDLSLTQPHIIVDTAKLPPAEEKDTESAPMSRIHLPISLAVDQVSVTGLLVQIDDTHIGLNNFNTALSLNNETGLTLEPTVIDQLSLLLIGHEEVQRAVEATTENVQEAAQNAKETVSEAQQQADKSLIASKWAKIERDLTTPLLADLHSVELPFDIHIVDIQGKDWQYQHQIGLQTQTVAVPLVQLKADATGYQAKLQTFEIQSSMGSIQGSGEISLQQDFPLNIRFQTTLNEIKDQQQIVLPKSTAELSLSGNLKKQTALSLKTTGIDAQLTGTVSLNEEKNPFQLQLTSPQLRYPFSGSDPLIAKNLDLRLQGNLLDYRLSFSGNAQGMGVPPSQLKLAVQGGLTQAQIEDFTLSALNGKTTVSGHVDWKEGLHWQSAVNFDKINTASHWKDWSAVLSGKIESTGFAKSDDWQVQLPTIDLQGTFSGKPLSLTGNLSAEQHNLLTIPQLVLNYGENKISLNGKLNEQSDLSAEINAPNLSGLLPDLRAALQGKIHIQGNIQEPDLNIDLNGSGIRFQSLNLAKFSIQSQIQSHEQIQGNAEIKLSGFQYEDFKISNLDLNAKGSEQQHSLTLRSQGDPAEANLDINGQFDRAKQTWTGSLSQVDIKSPIGNIKNSQTVNLSYDNTKLLATVSAHCWSSPEVELCFPQQFQAGEEGNVPFDIRKLDLALVNKLSGQDNLLKGRLSSQGKVAWFKDKPFALDIKIDGNNLAVSQKMDYRTFNLAIPSLSLNGKLENNNFSLKSAIRLQDQGAINTDLSVQDIAQKRQLGGSLELSRINLALANQLLSAGDKIGGKINANLRFGGNATAPLLNGNLVLDGLKVNMAAMPLIIDNGQLALNFHGNSSTLQGYIQSADSRLNLEGDANWRDLNRWEARVAAKANEFRVDIPNMARLKISPDVQVKATPTLVDLSGVIDIPWARIKIEELPESATSVSSDEVILDKAPSAKLNLAKQETGGMLIKSDLTINIGNNVWFDAYGLKSALYGTLSVRQEKGNLGLYGQVNLKNGRYASFGQDLLIRKGQISFSGLPSQPLLNIEAIRNPDAMEDTSVTAGVKVIGLAESPQVTIFSEPSMSQEQALSYILTGRSLEDSGEAGSSGSIGAALLGLGLAKSGKLVGGIGEAFGIKELNLGTQGVGDSSKVVVSGYITPRLQVKYGVGLFDALAEFTVRYRLMPQLYLQSVSGATQAFDLLYQFEF